MYCNMGIRNGKWTRAAPMESCALLGEHYSVQDRFVCFEQSCAFLRDAVEACVCWICMVVSDSTGMPINSTHSVTIAYFSLAPELV